MGGRGRYNGSCLFCVLISCRLISGVTSTKNDKNAQETTWILQLHQDWEASLVSLSLGFSP